MYDQYPKLLTAYEIQNLDIPEPAWAVIDLLPVGYSLLVGKPKLGKSWMALHTGLQVAQGKLVFDKYQTNPGAVIYYALEDTVLRLKKRLKVMLGNSPAPLTFHVRVECPRLDKDGIKLLENDIISTKDVKLVIIDTLQKVKPVRGTRDAYEHDYHVGGMLKKLADRYGLCILAVHHQRKAFADDPLDSVSGSTGITGAADTIMVLTRSRNNTDGELHVTGRDVEESQLALKFDKHSGSWIYKGLAQHYNIPKERREVIDLLSAKGGMKPKQIAEELGRTEPAIRKLLTRMLEQRQLRKEAHGLYDVPEENESHQSQVSLSREYGEDDYIL